MSKMRGLRAAACRVLIAVLAFALFGGPAVAQPLALNKKEILAAHNKYRAQVGVPPLTWSDTLAQGAQRWANTIAALNQLQHSHTQGVGENLAMWSGAGDSLATLIGMWAAEKQYFRPGTFPNVTSNGNWLSVAHYTQMVWRSTTQVGCGIGNVGHGDFLVCWYSPEGNYVGQPPY